MNDLSDSRLITVSNRLPIVVQQGSNGCWKAESGSGGLVTVLVPVLRDRGGLWIGWPGLSEASAQALEPVLSEADRRAG